MRVHTLLGLSLLWCGCQHAAPEPRRASLEGLTLPLLPLPALRATVAGQVGSVAAEIAFEPGHAVSVVTSGCVSRPEIVAEVSVPDAFGPDTTFSLARLGTVRLGDTPIRPVRAAVATGERCVLILGAPELEGVAVVVDPSRRVLELVASRSRAAWEKAAGEGGLDARVLPLTKEPRYDWPLITARIRHGPQVLDATYLVSLREPHSRVYESVAKAAGLRRGVALLSGLDAGTPSSLESVENVVWQSLELAPQFGIAPGSVMVEAGAPPHSVEGVLGIDLWSRFRTTVDVTSGVLILERPALTGTAKRVHCTRAGETSEAACFEVHATPTDGGLELTATVWKPLSEGAVLSLDLTGATGRCQVGVAFSPGGAGRSTHHHFPWKQVREALPDCAEELAGVTAAAPGLVEETPFIPCAGVCAWAREPRSGKTACECQPGARTAELERGILELYERGLRTQQKEREREPDDP